MKNLKEFLLFIAVLIIPFMLFLIITSFSADIISDSLSFVGIDNYIRLFLHDKVFIKALFNTVLKPAIASFLAMSVFALIVYLCRKKIKLPRWGFYLGGMFVGGITAFIYVVNINIAFFGVPDSVYNTQTIISHIDDTKPFLCDIITIPNVLFSLYIGVLTIFVFWVLELITDVVKNTIRKPRNKVSALENKE